MTLEAPTEEILAAIREAAGVNEEELEAAGNAIKSWLEEQPHLPNGHEEFDVKKLQLLYLQSNNRISKVCSSLDLYYTMRNTLPHVLCNRDPNQPWFKDICEACFYFPLSQLTDDFFRVTVAGLCYKDPGLLKWSVYDLIKMLTMVHDVRHFEEFSPFDVYIIDLQQASLLHISKFTFSAIKNMADIALARYRMVFKSVHFVNAPLYADVLIAICKVVLKPKIFRRFHVHRNGLGNLYEYVSPKFLPVEFGGHAGSIKDLWSDWQMKMKSHGDWFLKCDQLRTCESKRPVKR